MKNKTVYFVGIKGVGMAALACFYHDLGWNVLGSDVKGKFLTDDCFKNKNIKIYEAFDPGHIDKEFDLVIVTGAHGGMTNTEARQAKKIGIKTIMHGEALGEAMKAYFQVSVAGTHGKTTTSAFISSVLSHLGADPSYVVGTPNITDLHTSGHAGTGKYFIAEADEYATCPKTNKTPRFLWHDPNIAVITNIDFDHPDVYKDLEEVEKAFFNFAKKIKSHGVLIACSDNLSVRKILKRYDSKVITYGSTKKAQYYFINPVVGKGQTSFDVFKEGENLGKFTVSLFGHHNILNSLAVIITVHEMGYSYEKIRNVLSKFLGTKRRLELIHKKDGLIFIDDYAHHPSEIQSSLQGIKMGYPDHEIFVIFQPHTYSRTKALLEEFANSFSYADYVMIAPIYASARENTDLNFSSVQLVDKIKLLKKDVEFVKSPTEAANLIKSRLKKKSLILTMGAGDIYEWYRDLKEQLC
jgi:UDP-N-acetylmuramate--alanine ligase